MNGKSKGREGEEQGGAARHQSPGRHGPSGPGVVGRLDVRVDGGLRLELTALEPVECGDDFAGAGGARAEGWEGAVVAEVVAALDLGDGPPSQVPCACVV